MEPLPHRNRARRLAISTESAIRNGPDSIADVGVRLSPDPASGPPPEREAELQATSPQAKATAQYGATHRSSGSSHSAGFFTTVTSR